jgi:hypothetical protein
MNTIQGCEDKYEHRLKAGRSYLKKRWYYLDGMRKCFVTKCLKSKEFIPHHIDVTGYIDNDANKSSKQITTVYIENISKKKIELMNEYIDPELEPLPYQLLSDKDEPTESYTYEGCFKLTHTNRYKIYKRPDGTNLKEFIGIGRPIKSKNLCKVKFDTKEVYHHSHIVARSWKDPNDIRQWDSNDADMKIYIRVPNPVKVKTFSKTFKLFGHSSLRCFRYFAIHSRQIIEYPNGYTQYDDWKSTGKVILRDEYWATHDRLAASLCLW